VNSAKTPILQVAAKAAIVNDKNQVLIVRESIKDKNNTKVGFYGLVGGRLSTGESFMGGLAREVMEETGLVVEAIKPLYVGEWNPVIQGIPHQIVAIFMLCKTNKTSVKISIEHDDYIWIKPAERSKYPMMEPDCYAVDMLVDL
jgi:8-oxo-dGTP diphosphatase